MKRPIQIRWVKIYQGKGRVSESLGFALSRITELDLRHVNHSTKIPTPLISRASPSIQKLAASLVRESKIPTL